MGVLAALGSVFDCIYPNSTDPNRSAEEVNGTIIRAIAKVTYFGGMEF